MEELDPFSAAFGDEMDLESLEDGDATLVTSPQQSPRTSIFSQTGVESTPSSASAASDGSRASNKSVLMRLTSPEGLFRFLPQHRDGYMPSKRSSRAVNVEIRRGTEDATRRKRRDTGLILPQVAVTGMEGQVKLESLHFEELGLDFEEYLQHCLPRLDL